MYTMYIKSRGEEKRNEFRVREREQEVEMSEIGHNIVNKNVSSFYFSFKIKTQNRSLLNEPISLPPRYFVISNSVLDSDL